MHCPNCSKKIEDTDKFCPHCGYNISEFKKDEKENKKFEDKSYSQIATDKNAKLKKTFKDTGNSSIALSILGFILTIFVSLDELTLVEAVLSAVIMLPFLAPFFYFGKKLKEKGINNISYALKISRGMLIYTIIFVVVNMAFGGVGFLWLLLLYYYYKSYKETKSVLKNIVS